MLQTFQAGAYPLFQSSNILESLQTNSEYKIDLTFMYLYPAFYFILVLLLNVFIGFGISMYVYQGPLIKRLLLSPVIGYSIITLLTAYLSYLDIGTNQFAPWLFALLVLVSATGVLIKRPNWKSGEKISLKLLIPIILFGLANCLIVLAPTLLNNAPYLFNDHTTYIAISEYLRDFGYSHPANGIMPFWENNTLMYQEAHFRMGAQFFISFFAALFQTNHTIQIYPALLGLIAFLLMTAISFLYLSIKLPRTNIWELSTVLFFSLIAISLNSQNISIGFLPQTCGLILFIILTALLYEAFRENKVSVVASALFFAALVFTYHEITLFYCVGVLAFCMFEFFYKKNSNYSLFLKIAGTHIAALILSPIGTKEFVFGLQSSAQANDVGWNIPHSFLRYFQSILGQDIHYLLPNDLARYITLPGLIATFFIGYIVIKQLFQREIKQVIQFILVFFSPFAAALFLFAYLRFNPFDHLLGHTWRIFKLISWSYWIIPFIIGLAIYTYAKELKFKKLFTGLLILALLPSVAGNVYAEYLQKNSWKVHTGNDTNALGDLEYIATNPDLYRPANLIDAESHPNYPYLVLSTLKDMSTGDLDIYGVKLLPSLDPKYFPWVNYRKEHSNSGNLLTTKVGFFIYDAGSSTVYPDKGFGEKESSSTDHLAWLIAKAGTIKVIVPQGKKAQFTTEISNWHNIPAGVEIKLNDLVVFSSQIDESAQTFTSPLLDSGLYEFNINYAGELHTPDAADSRPLGLMFKNISIKNI